MSKKHLAKSFAPATTTISSRAEKFLHRALVHVTGAVGLLISISFFTGTYDTAQVKLTLLHMGGLLLAALWASLQLTRQKFFLTKQNLPVFLPLLVFIGWNILCYIFAPLHTEAAEEFIRFFLYGIITLAVANEFDLRDVKTLTKWLIVAVCISFAYGLVQVINGFFPGVDPVNWRGFFTKRVFATHANPNFFADFIIFSSCLMGGVFLATRQKKYIFLGWVGMVLLFFTESKGAWISYIAAVTLGVLLYTNYLSPAFKKHRLKINTGLLIAAVGVAVLAGVYTAKRYQSVSFRTYTWQGTWEMIKEHPVMGVGIGNFKTIYAAHRRPEIFYIESSHNIETQHAENELLEQMAVSGFIGLGLFLWLVYALFSRAWQTLRRPETPSENAYYLLGYTAAFGGMLVHSLVDVSIHFASSGFFFALFMGVLITLTYPAQQPTGETKNSAAWLIYVLRGCILTGLCVLDVWLVRAFYEVTNVLVLKTAGDFILVTSAWTVFVACLLGGNFIVWRAACLLRSGTALVPFILLLPLEWAAYCPFQANHYYNVGIALTNLQNPAGALGYFTKAIRLNPWQAEYRQFRANLFTVLLDLTHRFSPERGDVKGPSDDYSRALADYEIVQRHAPYHALLHHNRGQLYYKMALTRSDNAQRAKSPAEYELFKQEALDNMAQAKEAFARSLQTDPVNAETYMYLVQIGLLENNVDEAQAWLDKFRQGPDGVKKQEFLARAKNYPPADRLQQQINARRGQNTRREK